MATYPLKIVTPGGCVFDGAARRLSCRAAEGDVCIMARHCDYCTVVAAGEARLTLDDGAARRAACPGGFLTVQGGEACLIAAGWTWAGGEGEKGNAQSDF